MENEEENLYKELEENFELGFKKLSIKYSPVLFKYCKRTFGLNTEDAEEIVSDVLLTVNEKFSTFTFLESNSLSRWLFTITKNKIRDFLRKEKKFKSSNIKYNYEEIEDLDDIGNFDNIGYKLVSDFLNSEENIRRDGRVEGILEVFEELNEEEIADVYAYFYCIPYEDIARQTSKSLDAVKKRISRTIQKLLKKIIDKFNLKNEKIYETIKKEHQKDLSGRFTGK